MGGRAPGPTSGLAPCLECGYHGVLMRVYEAGSFVYTELSCGDCAYYHGTFKSEAAALSLLMAMADWNSEIEE